MPPPEPSLSARVRRGAAWSALSTLLLRAVNIAVTAVVAHILAPSDFGAFAVALTVYTIVFSIGELGVGSCLIRADLDIDAMAPSMVTVSVVTGAILAVVMVVCARPIAAALGSPAATGPVEVMALVMLINVFSAVPSAQLTRDLRQDKLFIANVVSLVPSMAVLLVLAKSGSGAMAFAWSRVAAQLVMGGVMIASVPKIYRPGLHREPLRVLVRFGFPLAGANVIYFILLNVDYALVGHLIGAVGLGTYMLAFNLASAPGFLLGAVINSVAMPAFSRVKGDPELLKKALASALSAAALIVMPMCGLLAVLARPLVLTVYGGKWAASAEVLAILSVYGAISISCILFANLLTSLGKARSTFVIQLIWLGALAPAMAAGVHRNGIIGAAVAHIAVIGPLVLPSYLFVLRRATGVRLGMLGRAIVPALAAASAASLAAQAAASQLTSPPFQLAVGLGAGGLIYLVAVAPQALLFVGAERAASLRKLRVFRVYASVATLAGTSVNLLRGQPDGYRPRHAEVNTGREPAAAMADEVQPSGQARITELLRPEARVAPFWPRQELAEMLSWCREPGTLGVRLVTGEGGAGKTRLAIEAARALAAEHWLAVWVRAGKEAEALAAVSGSTRPTLVLADYAETRTGLAGFLAGATGDHGPKLRVVLLARNVGDWWHNLVSSAEDPLAEQLAAARQVRLGPVTGEAAQREVFDGAAAAFAGRLGVGPPAATPVLPGSGTVVLALHAAALSAVLDQANAASLAVPVGSADVFESLLRREIRYGSRVAAARGLDIDPSVQRRAIVAASLIGAPSEPAAAGLLRRLPDFAESAAERRGQVARWLHDLYPGQTAGDRGTEWLGSLRPDAVVEQLIVGELTQQPSLASALFTWLDEERVKKGLTILARAAYSYPYAGSLLARVLAADLEHLAIPALAVAAETNPALDRLVAGTVAAQKLPVPALEHIAAAIPRRSPALAATAVTVLRRLADESSATERVRWLNELSARLAELGRHDEAAAVAEEAAASWRKLGTSRPGGHPSGAKKTTARGGGDK